MFNTCKIKNLSANTESVLGVQLAVNEEYTIPDTKRIQARNDSTILERISNGTLQVGNGTSYFSNTATQINYLNNEKSEIDDDGRQIVKSATTYKGWRYLAHVIELETSKLNGCFSQDWLGTTRSDFTMNFYDSNDNELTAGTQAELDSDCVKTVITLAPDYDYDIIGGNIHQHETPTENVRLWVIAGATDLGAAGSKEFVGGLNMRFMGSDEQIETDGRASARMNKTTTGVPVPTNKVQYIIKHPAGFKHELMLVMEYFRA